MKRGHLAFGAVLLLAVLAGAWFSLHGGRAESDPAEPGGARAPRLVLYTNPGVTTPQIPFWAAYEAGALASVLEVDLQEWRGTAQLQSLLLAGNGDIWIGHIDGFARARALGAPVVLVAVTGWRKMSIVSLDSAVTGVDAFLDQRLAFAPVGSPSVTVLQAILGSDAERIQFDPHEPKQLALRMMRGDVRSALLAEPLVTVLLEKMPELRVVCDLEDMYAAKMGGESRMPLAGVAVHRRLLDASPGLVAALFAEMKAAAGDLAGDPERAAAVLPTEFADFVPANVVRASLARDIILVEAAGTVKSEIVQFLGLVAPDLQEPGANRKLVLEDDFFWKPEE